MESVLAAYLPHPMTSSYNTHEVRHSLLSCDSTHSPAARAGFLQPGLRKTALGGSPLHCSCSPGMQILESASLWQAQCGALKLDKPSESLHPPLGCCPAVSLPGAVIPPHHTSPRSLLLLWNPSSKLVTWFTPFYSPSGPTSLLQSFHKYNLYFWGLSIYYTFIICN